MPKLFRSIIPLQSGVSNPQIIASPVFYLHFNFLVRFGLPAQCTLDKVL